MSEVPSERDDRLALLLTEALDAYRGGETVDVADLQARHPDLAGEIPELLETLLTLDTAVEDWKRIASPETRQLPPGVDTSEPAAAPTLPAKVGRYRILGRLGQGGMGTVYRAEDPQLQRVVALKVPRFEGPERLRETAVKRFLREARAAAQVRHPHVCPIYDVGEQDGVPYVVMDYVEGQSLADRLSDRQRYDDPAEAARLVRQVAEALEAVHARGLVHRDLKPGNILLDASGRAILTDFGLARSDQDAEHLTADGTLLGTPAYMAPEQASLTAGPVGPWTDVYSLGVVLYQMLTGRLPFEGPVLQVLHGIANETPAAPSQSRPDLDPALEAIVLKAMGRRKEERYQSAREFADALERWAPGSPHTTADHAPAEKPLPVERPPTVVQSALPDGSVVTVTLQPGAAVPRKLDLTVRDGRTRRKRRVLAVSLSVTFMIVALGVCGVPYLVQRYKGAGPDQVALAPQDRLAAKARPEPEITQKAAPAPAPDHPGGAESAQGGGALPLQGAGNPIPPAGGANPVAPADTATTLYPPAPAVEKDHKGGRSWATATFSFGASFPLEQKYDNVPAYGQAGQEFPPYAFSFNAPRVTTPLPFLSPSPVRPVPYSSLNDSAYGTASTSPTPYTLGLRLSYAASPGVGGYGAEAGYNPYYSYADPYGGGLRGVADIMRAQGAFEKDAQQVRLLTQEVERSRVDPRRKMYDEWLYERTNTPTLVDIQKTQQLENRRTLLGMPQSEILNGYALNSVLDDLRKKGNLNAKDPHGPIDPDVLKQVNVTSRGGNVGVLKPVKEGATLNWPLPLQGAAYQDEVRPLNQRAAEAVRLVQNAGSVDPGTLNDMKEDIRRLRTKLGAHVDELTPAQLIEGNRFLNQLSEAETALAQPDVASYFTDRFAAKGKTVPELVQYMAQKGLKFAPATGGDEAAYSTLYNYLVSYALQAGQAGGH